MNLPNMTLFIQMIHFAIAYWFMRKFIFDPALHIINAQELYKKNLENKINETQVVHQESIKQQYVHWNSIKESLYKLIPKLVVPTIGKKTTVDQIELDTVKLSLQDKQELSKVLQRELSDVKS